MELGGGHIDREVGAGGSVSRGEMPLGDSTAVEQHVHIEIRVQLLRGSEIIDQAKEHHGCLLGGVPPVSAVAIEHQPLRCLLPATGSAASAWVRKRKAKAVLSALLSSLRSSSGL